MAFVLEVLPNLLGRRQKRVLFSTSRRPSKFVTFSRNQRCRLFSISATLNTPVQSVDEKHLARVNDVAIPIMVNSCMGKMGQAIIEAGISAGLHIVPASFGIQRDAGKTVQVGGKDIQVHGPSDRESALASVLEEYPNLIVVDFTVPNAVNENAELYCKTGVPFVMGTTGGDRDLLYKTVEDSNLYAVISPQMGKQVVAFLAAMEIMSKQFPGAFTGYTLEVLESHQHTKLDTSGTAKAVISCFQKLGVSFDVDQVQLIRDPKQQVEMVGVPEEYLDGHAFHMYHLTSSDGTVSFEFQHNVCGRSIYAEGAIDAALFLAKKDIFSAGSETSSATAEWAMSEMMKYPKILEKAQTEVRDVVNRRGSIDGTCIQELVFLKLVIKETLRLHPSTPLLLPRESRERCEINGYEIPAKCKVLVNAWAINRDPIWWKDPEKFDPERFLNSSTDYKGLNFEYIPFGAGRRVCPGMTFALPNIELPLVKMLYHFDWKLPDGISSENLDMIESFGMTIKRKENLKLIPTAYYPLTA